MIFIDPVMVRPDGVFVACHLTAYGTPETFELLPAGVSSDGINCPVSTLRGHMGFERDRSKIALPSIPLPYSIR